MSDATRELRVRFTGDAGDLTRASRDAERAMREVERTQQQTGISAAELGRKLGGLAAAYISLSTAAAAAQKGLQGLASIEQSELTFKVLFQSADQAKAKMQELVQFAAKTPFELPGIVDAAKKLETFGLNSTKYLKDAGDLAAAFNVEISEVASAFGRLNSGDFGEAFERLRDFGIARRDLEGEGLVFDKSGSYQGSVDQALTAVQAIIRKKFGGMMEEQSRTFTGQMSTLADNVQTTLNTVMTPAFEGLTSEVKKLNTAFDETANSDFAKNAQVIGTSIASGLWLAAEAGKSLADTLNHVMTPLRWIAEQSERFGTALGERAILQARVLADTKNFPIQSRRERIAKMVGSGSDLRGVAEDMWLNTTAWRGDNAGKNREMGALAVIMGDVKNIVSGLKQYKNFEPYGPEAPAGGTTRPTNTATGPGNTDKGPKVLTGADLWERQNALGMLSDGKYHKLLSDHIKTLTKNTAEYFSALDDLKDLEGTIQRKRGRGTVTQLTDEYLGITPKRTGPASYLSDEDLGIPDAELAEQAERALHSGLEAGVAAFLDGGIQGFGESLYSVSKDRLTTAIADSLMNNADVKGFLGGLGANTPLMAGLGVAALGYGLYDGERKKVDGWRKERESFAESLIPKSETEREVERLNKRNKEIRDDLNSGNPMDPIRAIFSGDKHREIALNEQYIAGLQKRIESERTLAEAAASTALALNDVADRGNRISDSVSSTELLMKLNGIKEDDPRANAYRLDAFRGGLNNAGFDTDMASRLVGDKELQKSIVSQFRFWSQDGFSSESSNDDYLENLFGGRFKGEALKSLLEGTLLPMFSRLADLNPATQSIGSMSNPESALMFDAPQTRNVVNNNSIAVNTYAITGDKASIRELARIMATEMATLQGQAV